MPCYYNSGKVLLLEVPMENVLTMNQKNDLMKLFHANHITTPKNWLDTDDYNVDAEYHEVLEGYLLEDHTSKQLLSDVFAPTDPVEPQGVKVMATHDLNDRVQRIAPNAKLVFCFVAYVSIDIS